MGVSQQAIADALGLSRTTVTKILNRDPKYSASETTRDAVFAKAEQMGYDFTTIRRPFKREYGRAVVNASCELEVVLQSGEVFDKGQAVARNIGVGGALLSDIRLPKCVLPLARFTFRIRFAGLPALANLVGECQVVRIADSSDAGRPEFGVRFVNASDADRALLKGFLDEHTARTEAEARKVPVSGPAGVTP